MYPNMLKYFSQNILCRACSLRGQVVQRRAVKYSHARGGHVDVSKLGFNDARLAMQTKSFGQLLTSIFILKLCQYSVFVDNSEKLVNLTKKVFGKQLYEAIVKNTFYKQFVAGEDENDVKDVAMKLKDFNVYCMFCVPTEDILSDSSLHDAVIKEDEYEVNLKLLLGCVGLTALYGTYAQVKVTATVNSDIMHDVAKLMQNHIQNHTSRPPSLRVETWSKALGRNYQEDFIPELSKTFNIHIGKALGRLDLSAKSAQEQGVKLMLDAEHTYIQPSIDTVILALQQKYNQNEAIVYNTYQCYRKDTPSRIESDIALAKKHNFKIACKLVRGAYMDFERQRAKEVGYPDPICDTYEETGENYKKAMDLMLSMVSEGKGEVMFATHNEDCILYGIKRMNELGISPNSGEVCFGQLYGMCDHISYALGDIGYLVHKSVPYGSLDHSILYLIRRAQENKSVLARTSKESRLLLQEIKRRITRS